MAHVQEDWTLPGSDSQPIFGTTHLPARGQSAAGAVLLCHGFKGYKDYGFLPRLSGTLAEAGLIAHRFNFSHSGVTPRFETFERPDLFEKDTWSRQILDLQIVAGAARDGRLAGRHLPQVWFGHSRGGVTARLAAARAAAMEGSPVPSGLVSAAAPADACNLSDEQCDLLRRQRRLASPSSRTQQTLHVGGDWLAEIEQDPQAFDPIAAGRQIRCPMLIIHGTADTTVPPDDAQRLQAGNPQNSRVEMIEGASHTFDAPNPLAPEVPLPPATQRLVGLTREFALACVASA